MRRKRIRSEIAHERDRLLLLEEVTRAKSPSHIQWLEEQAALEEFARQEEARLSRERHLKWQADELEAQQRWKEQQIRLAEANAEKEKHKLLIKEEWEREQKKLKEEEERKRKEQEEKKKRNEELLAQIEAFIAGTADLPASAVVGRETQPGHPECPFFSKTGACRFRDNCSRNHICPGISNVLLISSFYEHFGMHTERHHEYDTDVSLEYEDFETYSDFKEFFYDILPEFESCGALRQLKVCCNYEPHLRGNVYVEYLNERHALKAYQLFQGRYYAGRQLSVMFVNIPSWKNALCGLFHKQRCPKGRHCNFLHAFRNPGNAFRNADFDRSPPHSSTKSSSHDDWRWSPSPENMDAPRRPREKSRRNRSRSSDRRRNRSRSSEKRKREYRKRESCSREDSKSGRGRSKSNSRWHSGKKRDRDAHGKENTPSPKSRKVKDRSRHKDKEKEKIHTSDSSCSAERKSDK
ncbi:U2 small nuclear ribonucleoprotein auxiliary factor 35 kDa subunit-related protein 1 isoform X2 [Nilaparvata lugens]|nr:U2 small nuclear ribonucleoprotein auxiliary factor 35 kDa subunit-related protein 1 isoform X2 [Nilaparvata lugens]